MDMDIDDLSGEPVKGWPDNNLEHAIRHCDWMVDKIRNHAFYAQNLYAAICNNQFVRAEVFPILKEEYWTASWRYAGGLMAEIRGQGDYMDFYCSGITNEAVDPDGDQPGIVAESRVTPEIRSDLERLGWLVIPYPDSDYKF